MSVSSYKSPIDEKNYESRLSAVNDETHANRSQRRKTLLRFCSIVLALLVLRHFYFIIFSQRTNCKWGSEENKTTGRVDLEAHIMSKCPDARDCLQKLVVPTMEQVSDKVNFRLSYIGKVDDDSDGVACMHGPSECLGNIIQLCAARIHPEPKIFLGFANCMTSNYSQIPDRDLIEYCALEHGVDFDKVNKCISDEGHGSDLLRQSIIRSQENNVTKSCTVRLANKVRCIRDGGKWYDCPGGSEVEDLVHDIKRLYDEQLD